MEDRDSVFGLVKVEITIPRITIKAATATG